MAEEPRPPTQEEGAAAGAAEPGAPIPPDAVDPELIRLPVPPGRRHPGVAIAVLIIGALLLYRLRADIHYAMEPATARDLGSAATAVKEGRLGGAAETFVSLTGIPDHRNALAYDPKGGRARVQVFRLLGTGSRLFVTSPATPAPPYADRWSGRLRRLDDLSFAETLRTAWGQTQVLRALDLPRLRALPPGQLPSPLETVDRAGEALKVANQQDLLVDVLFEDDVRVLLSKEKSPSEPDARHEVERLGLAHGPGVETKDGYGYVLRLPPKATAGAARQQVLAQIDAQGMWLWHRVETYRVPVAAVQVTPAGLALPGPDSLAQPIRYAEQTRATAPAEAPTAAPTGAAATPPAAAAAGAPAAEPAGPRQLVAQKEPSTLLLWEQIQAVQVSEPLNVPADAMLLVDGDDPKSLGWTLPMAGLLVLFMAFNVWYLIRSLRNREAAAD